jgi:gliding motility-associated-like protein
VTIAQVNLTITTPATSIGGGAVPAVDSTTGQISVPAGTPAGIYTIVYQICEKANPTNCDSATVTITVTAPVIVAQDDTFIDVDGANGSPNIGNALNNNGNGNDTLNGVNVTIAQVNLTVTTPATPIGGGPVPSIDSTTGQISVPAGTPAGTYTIVYQICEKANPTNCDSAIVTINVGTVKGVDCEAVVIRKAFTPNGDGVNDYLQIDGVEDNNCYPSGISVEIYNRWGILVFETAKYSNTDNYFDGYSRGRTTISKSEGLPTGTYFYILNYESSDGNGINKVNKKEGFIYLSR